MKFDEMEYKRPNIEEFEKGLYTQLHKIRTSSNLDETQNAIQEVKWKMVLSISTGH